MSRTRDRRFFIYSCAARSWSRKTLLLVNNTSLAQGAEKPAKTASRKFIFTAGKVEAGSIRVSPDTNYHQSTWLRLLTGSKVGHSRARRQCLVNFAHQQ